MKIRTFRGRLTTAAICKTLGVITGESMYMPGPSDEQRHLSISERSLNVQMEIT
jgi:hypothetical protein